MKVILTEDVERLGKAGNVLNVADGYGRNYLIPRGLALQATAGGLRTLEHQKRTIAAKIKKVKKLAEALASRIGETTVTIQVQVGEEGQLFGSVTTKDIAEALAKEGIDLDRKKILLEGPLKELGTFTAPIMLHPEVTAPLTVWVVKAE